MIVKNHQNLFRGLDALSGDPPSLHDITDLRRRSRDMRERHPLFLRGVVNGDDSVAAPPMKRRGWSSEESLGLGHKKLGPTNLWAALWLAEPKGFSKEKLGPNPAVHICISFLI